MAKNNKHHEALTTAAAGLLREACVGLNLELRSQYLDLAFPSFPLGGANAGPRPMRHERRPRGFARVYDGDVTVGLPAKCTRLPSYEWEWLYKGPNDVVCGRMSVHMSTRAEFELDLSFHLRPRITGGYVAIYVYGCADENLRWSRGLTDGHELAMGHVRLWLERWASLQQLAQRAWKTGPAMMTRHDPADGTERPQPPHGLRSYRGKRMWNTYYEECYRERFDPRGGWHIPDPAAFVTREQLRSDFEMERY